MTDKKAQDKQEAEEKINPQHHDPNRTTQSTAPYEGPEPQVRKRVEGAPPNNHPEDNAPGYMHVENPDTEETMTEAERTAKKRAAQHDAEVAESHKSSKNQDKGKSSSKE